MIVVAGAWYSIALQDAVVYSEPVTSTIIENKDSQPIIEKSEPTEKVAVSFPSYTGQAIMIFGSDPIINQFSQSVIEKQKKYLADLNAALQKNPYDFDSWMQVGNHKKFFNNYEGARDAWEYAKLLVPAQQLSYLNLANLYAYYLKDFAKAEAHYFAATERDFNNISGSYTAFAAFYRDFGFPDKALEWYQSASEFDPNDPALLTEIERLKNAQ